MAYDSKRLQQLNELYQEAKPETRWYKSTEFEELSQKRERFNVAILEEFPKLSQALAETQQQLAKLKAQPLPIDEGFKPFVVTKDKCRAQVVILLSLHLCESCGIPLLNPGIHAIDSYDNVGHVVHYRDPNISEICNECAKGDNYNLECAICYERRPAYEIQTRVSDQAAFCQFCYQSVSAAAWDEYIQDAQEKYE